MWNIRFFFILLVYSAILNFSNGYETPSNPQYHIQTDEGPERYFRYQTLSGQFRKEKRMEDGTVIGTYAWIDDDGILRQRDYIADNAGYRILKTKNLFVGKNIPVADAMKLAKKFPASAGTLVSSKPNVPVPVRPVVTVAYNQPTIPSTTQSPVTAAPAISTTGTPCAHCSTAGPTTPKPDILYGSTTLGPYVEILNNALPSSTNVPFISTTEKPYVEITPGSISSTLGLFSTTTTPSPETGLPLEFLKTDAHAINNLQYQDTSTTTPGKQLPAGVQYSPSPYDTLPTYTEPDQNSLDINPYISPINNGFVFQNGPTYPIDRNGHTYRGTKRYSNPRIGNGYDKQYQEYDGVSVTNDGFRYYIPRAYHEEHNGPDHEKSGSFGYIDPFGIRRVIYYNAKPGEGFQHRKNNRYVGFDATPYDPRPY